jgi:hypothetical protein
LPAEVQYASAEHNDCRKTSVDPLSLCRITTALRSIGPTLPEPQCTAAGTM